MTKATNGLSPQATSSQQQQICCPVVELRQYTLHPQQRDVLIELFDREFVESQEAVGMRVIGQFRDLDDPNRFVWLRGFRNMSERAQGLNAFYGGPIWKANREAANATMIDSDNVLLLRPAHPRSGFTLVNNRDEEISAGIVIATIYYLNAPADAGFVVFFERTLKPMLTNTGATVLAYFITESGANNFPVLPVREGENIFVWFCRFSDLAAYAGHVAALTNLPQWCSEVLEELGGHLKIEPEVLKLSPTARSQLR
jgi:hypothetical protein